MTQFTKRATVTKAVEVQISDTDAISIVRSGFEMHPYLVTYHDAFGETVSDVLMGAQLKEKYELGDLTMRYIGNVLGL